MKFTELKKAVIKEQNERKQKTLAYIANGYENRHDIGLERYSTDKRWEQYQNNEIAREKAVEYASKRFLKNHEAETKKRLEKLGAVEAASDIEKIKIFVEWKRSATWGNNPHAEVSMDTVGGFNRYNGSASGCGYDKRSAAVANCLNESPAALKVIYTLKEKALRKKDLEPLPYGCNFKLTALPYFEGGVGVSCFWECFKMAGFNVEADESGKHTDYYFIYK